MNMYAERLNAMSPGFHVGENRLMNSLIRNGKGVNMQVNAHGYIEIYLFQHNRRAD
jgi:hypothetical protein